MSDDPAPFVWVAFPVSDAIPEEDQGVKASPLFAQGVSDARRMGLPSYRRDKSAANRQYVDILPAMGEREPILRIERNKKGPLPKGRERFAAETHTWNRWQEDGSDYQAGVRLGQRLALIRSFEPPSPDGTHSIAPGRVDGARCQTDPVAVRAMRDSEGWDASLSPAEEWEYYVDSLLMDALRARGCAIGSDKAYRYAPQELSHIENKIAGWRNV